MSPPGGDFSDPVTTATLSIVQVGWLACSTLVCLCALCLCCCTTLCRVMWSCWGPGLLCPIGGLCGAAVQGSALSHCLPSKLKFPLSLTASRALRCSGAWIRSWRSASTSPPSTGSSPTPSEGRAVQLLLPLLLPSACCCCCCRLPPLLPSAAVSCLQSCCMRHGLPCPLLCTYFFAGLLSLAGISRRWSPSMTALTPASLRRARRPARSCRRRMI